MTSVLRSGLCAGVLVAVMAAALPLSTPTASAAQVGGHSTIGAASRAGSGNLPNKRVVKDGPEQAGQLVDATKMILKAAPSRGRKAVVNVKVPNGLLGGSVLVFYINTDRDSTPEVVYYAGVDSNYQGYRTTNWDTTGKTIPIRCGKVRAHRGATTAKFAFNPRCIAKKSKSFSMSFVLYAGSDSTSNQDDWLPNVRKFSRPVRTYAR